MYVCVALDQLKILMYKPNNNSMGTIYIFSSRRFQINTVTEQKKHFISASATVYNSAIN